MKYFSVFGLAAVLSSAAVANDEAIARGEVLASEKGCVGCHGLNGVGIGPTFPNIGGQHRNYLVEQLKHYRSGFRQNAIMAGQAANLTDGEIFELSAYYASQPHP